MDSEYRKDLQEIQKTELDILKEFIRICNKHDIPYFLLEGSMLGAVRHQGMIPWDDDIDVGLFRNDYEKFLKIASGELSYPYVINDYRTRHDYKDYITQLVNCERKVQTSYRKKGEITNIWIDVFVIDGMPKDPFHRLVHKYKLLLHKLLIMWSDLDHYLVTARTNRPLYERIAIKICRVFHFERIIDSRRALEQMDRCLKSVKVDHNSNTVNFMSEYKWRTVFPPEYYGNGKDSDFDGIKATIPERAEEMLELIYGDYLEYPPEEERYKHSLCLVK